MKKCVIFCAAECRGLLEPVGEGDFVIAADGGLRHTEAFGISPNEILGDFDSLGYVPEGAVVHPVEKDDTDAMLAVRLGLELGRKRFVLYGAMVLAGLVLTIFFWNAMAAFRMTGLGLTIGGSLCLYYGIHNAGARKREMSALSREDALQRCAWECLIDGAPKKNDINDITYADCF